MVKEAVPFDILEEYYQINEAIFSSFSKYRPPLDLFVFNETIMKLVPFSRKGDRLSNEQVEEIQKHCELGNLFVSRADHPVYSKHIVKQLDLVLVDQQLKEGEVVSITIQALYERLSDLFDQPVKPVYERLESDVKVVTEYLWNDKHKIKIYLRRIWVGEHSLAYHSINAFIIGLWLLSSLKKDLTRKEFDQAAIALLLHDIGMSKIPLFILQKTTPLKPDEKSKIPPHVLGGAGVTRKLELRNEMVEQAILEHHERLDGSGYPQHKKDMSQFGRMTAVVDALSAMIQIRPYAPAKNIVDAAKELTADTTHFDLAFSGPILAAALGGSFNPIVEKK